MNPPHPEVGDVSPAVWDELAVSQQLGLIGPRSLDDHVQHAFGYRSAGGVLPRSAADLGPGGGLPSMVLADSWPESHWTLIDARERAIARLEVMVARLGWTERFHMLHAAAEAAGRRDDLRGHLDLVTARGFGPAAMTAECGAPLLRVGGRLVVSEPPDGADRWPDDQLSALGLRRLPADDPQYVVLEAVRLCPAAFPRRVGLPRNRPLW